MEGLAQDSEGGREGQIKAAPSLRSRRLARLGVGAPSPPGRRWRDWKELRAISRLCASGAPARPMDEFEDDFLLRPGRIAKGRGGKAGRSFLGQVQGAATRASDAGGGVRRGGGRAAAGRGRGACLLTRTGADQRRVIIKTRVVRHGGSRFRAAPLARHIAYLEREGVTRDGDKAHMFDAGSEAADIKAFAQRCEGDRHHFRFIVSPADAGELADLRDFARGLMHQAETDLETRLDWIAVDHWNTDNPHLHILVRGKDQDGADLVIAGDYLGRAMRERAQAQVTLELGPRTERQIAVALQAEVTAERWTSLDRDLRWAADRAGGVIDLRPDQRRSEPTRQLLLGRSAHLERLGLAEPVGPARWRLADDAEARLRDLSIRGDIIKTLHRAMTRDGRSVDPARFAVHDEVSAAPVMGRLVERGLNDELVGTAYAVVDGVDGRQHHVAFNDLADTGDAKPGAIVELRAFVGERGQAVRQLATRSDLDLAAQVKAQGATWLDRQLVHRSGLAGHGGFAQEAQAAMVQRGEVLVERGLARRFGDRLVLSPGVLDTLKSRDLDAARIRLATETGLAPKAAATGDAVAGVYRRRLDLASGRFAMIDDGLGFQLVPWRPRLDASLGRAVAGVVLPSGEVQWGRSRSRGLGL